MFFEFRTCKFELDYETYTRFLLQHHDQLGLPYSFALKLSFLSSPLIFGKAMLIVSEEPYEAVGAAGYVYGTGANDYEDRHIAQVEVAFLQQPYRRTLLFLRSLQHLLTMMKEGNPEVEQVQFWTSADDHEQERLFSKFKLLPGASASAGVNNMTFYTVPFNELEVYCGRLEAARGRRSARR
ncbi:hypothetical protein [Paenibacillus thalictri]|uniref:GNAT family N-acetyltransferase n=1 Tax=Paenibacillus thalictri TaxID=2527873 RepID=A0A4Q9DMK3_9BACL|nr:hypothetical protein [Paenibacillus thalictri]TBL73950.1 hypothetical protein EYB31_25990 [Paenibacillus thalictri]